MNFSSLLGVVLGISVMYAALHATTDNLSFFLDLHGILIVCGGTLAAASISFPIGKILHLVKVFILRVMGRRNVRYQDVIAYKERIDVERSKALDALAEQGQALKMGYE